MLVTFAFPLGAVVTLRDVRTDATFEVVEQVRLRTTRAIVPSYVVRAADGRRVSYRQTELRRVTVLRPV